MPLLLQTGIKAFCLVLSELSSSLLFHYTGESGEQVLLLCIPSFDLTQSCALVDLGTLQCQEISFQAPSLTRKHNPDRDRLALLDFVAEDEDQELGKAREEERGVTMMQDLDDSDEDMDM